MLTRLVRSTCNTRIPSSISMRWSPHVMCALHPTPISFDIRTVRFSQDDSSKKTSSSSSSSSSQTTSPDVDADDHHFRLATQPHPLDKIKLKKSSSENVGSKFDKKIMPTSYMLMHPVYSKEELDAVDITHRVPTDMSDRIALACVRVMRTGFDVLTGYGFLKFNESRWLRRFLFLETVAGVPGMVAAMLRHLRSLRRMQRDYGWIRTLLEEAENERMHLLTFMQMKKPSFLFRACVIITQGVFANAFFLAYILSPRFCHRFVGYLEEEAVITYTKAIKDLDDGKLEKWAKMPAPDIAVRYWKLGEGAMMRDLLLAVRADESSHRFVNHTFSTLKKDKDNPFPSGASKH